jgi:hypothetical protein
MRAAPQPQAEGGAEPEAEAGACALLAGAFPSRRAARAAQEQAPGALKDVAAADAAELQQRPLAHARRSARPLSLLRQGGDAAAAAAAAAGYASQAAPGDLACPDLPSADAAAANDGDSSDGGAGKTKKRPASRLLTRPHGCGCVVCGATSTPVWRTGPQGPKTLCNRCGVRFSKMSRRK